MEKYQVARGVPATLRGKIHTWGGEPVKFLWDFVPGYDLEADETFCKLIKDLDIRAIAAAQYRAMHPRESISKALQRAVPGTKTSTADFYASGLKEMPEFKDLLAYLSDLLFRQQGQEGLTKEELVKKFSSVFRESTDLKDVISVGKLMLQHDMIEGMNDPDNPSLDAPALSEDEQSLMDKFKHLSDPE